MCDLLLLRRNGRTWFAKNSDREPGEAQLVVRVAPVSGDSARTLQTTYLEIPQTSQRYGVLLSKPAWMWGAEMGANDQGLVIGNTAIFSLVHESQPGLIGMDLLRLALERAATAREALDLIAELLQAYGQGGACGFRDKNFQYDNSFIIADHAESWVMETAQRHWVARRITNWASTSNCMTIGREFDLASKGIADFAISRRLLKPGADLDFAGAFQQKFMPWAAGAWQRNAHSRSCLEQLSSESTLIQLMTHLRRHHHPGISHWWRRNSDICMHACGTVRRSQTCGSMLSELSRDGALHLFTGTSAPCLSIFRPLNMSDTATHGPTLLTADTKDERRSLWWRHERLHRKLILNEHLFDQYRHERDQVESTALEQLGFDPLQAAMTQYQSCNNLIDEWHEGWLTRAAALPWRYLPPSPYGFYWRKQNRMEELQP